MDDTFFVGLLFLALVKATPLVLGSMCGLMCERSGVINIGIEGMMLVGAMTGFLGSVFFNDLTGGTMPKMVSLLVGLLVAMICGGLIGLLHAWLSIHYKVDQIISGTVINLLAVGITNFTANAYIDPNQVAGIGVFPTIEIPLLSKIPILGPIFFQHQPLVYVMLILVFVVQYALFHTPWGLRTRSVGEHPRAADTVGINVLRTRYINVTLGGVLAGMAGAFLVLQSVGRFQKLMTTGRGFIALAALIFGSLVSGPLLGRSLQACCSVLPKHSVCACSWAM
jgi:simple sugar transport system permease protein